MILNGKISGVFTHGPMAFATLVFFIIKTLKKSKTKSL
jgi:hypothetical protein